MLGGSESFFNVESLSKWTLQWSLVIHGDPVQAALRALLFLGGGSGQRESSAHESLEVWQERPGPWAKEGDWDALSGDYIWLQVYFHCTINGRHAHSFMFTLEYESCHAHTGRSWGGTSIEWWLSWPQVSSMRTEISGHLLAESRSPPNLELNQAESLHNLHVSNSLGQGLSQPLQVIGVTDESSSTSSPIWSLEAPGCCMEKCILGFASILSDIQSLEVDGFEPQHARTYWHILAWWLRWFLDSFI